MEKLTFSHCIRSGIEVPRWLELQELAKQMIGEANVFDQLPGVAGITYTPAREV